MTRPCIFILAICSLLYSNALAQFPSNLQKGQQVDISFTYVNGFMVVPVVFNGIFSLNFIFDTGAEHTILAHRQITDLLQINYQRRFTLLGADLSTELYAYLAPDISLKVGQVVARRRPILVLEEDYMRFSDYAGMEIAGILGADFFRQYVVEIDYERRRITLHNPSGYQAPDGFKRIDIDVKRSKPYLTARTAFKSGQTKELTFLLDSGAALPLMINLDTQPELQLPERVVPANLGHGLGGFLVGYKGRLKELSMPPFAFREVVCSFQDRSSLPVRDSSLLDQRNGIIGNKILERFTVIIDYFREDLYLKPNRHYSDAFDFDRSGMLLVAGGPNLTHFYIYSVLDDSPARSAGLQPGDRIMRINWMPASMLTLESINERLKKRPGKKIRMVVKRDGKRLRKTLILRDLL